jgi:hypothetical protein
MSVFFLKTKVYYLHNGAGMLAHTGPSMHVRKSHPGHISMAPTVPLPSSQRSRVPVPVTPDPATFFQAITTIYGKTATHNKIQQLLITHQYERID